MATAQERTLVWPDGSIYRITRSTAETAGERIEIEMELPAGAWAPQPHVHPRLTEEYEVLQGTFDVLLGREWRTLSEGEVAVVPPGTVHTFRAGNNRACVRNVHRPALDFEPHIEALCAAARDKQLGDLSNFRSLLQLAVLIRAYPLHSRAPGRLLNAAVPTLAFVGRLLGYRAR